MSFVYRREPNSDAASNNNNNQDDTRIVSKDMTRVLVYPSGTAIHAREFYNCLPLMEAELPYGLKTIGRSAFERCLNLTKLSIPGTVEKIGDRAFGGCFHMKEVSFEEGLQHLGNGCFRGCSSLKQVSLPKTVNYVGQHAFSSCWSLVQVEIPKGGSLEVIQVSAFCGCTSLPYIAFPSNIKEIQESAFSRCESLVDVGFAEGIRLIGASAFRWCRYLARLQFPSTLETIGEWAFGVCKFLTHVDFAEGLQTIEENAFSDCSALRAISIPATTQQIGTCAFNDCLKLVTVEFPATSKVHLGSFAFQGCKSLVNLSVPSTIENLQGDEFCACPLLAIGSMEELNDRFERLPLHRACYHHTQTTNDTLIILLQDKNNESDWIDAFGMTPFHILVTSTNLRADLFLVLLDACPLHILAQTDPTSKNFMEYLMVDPSPMSTNITKMVLRRVFVDGMLGWGLESWRSEISSQVETLAPGSGREDLHALLNEMEATLASYGKVEKTSILELALWNTRIKSFEQQSNEITVDRESCRTKCGADFVIPNVSMYLWDTATPPMAIASSLFPYDLSWLDKSREEVWSTVHW